MNPKMGRGSCDRAKSGFIHMATCSSGMNLLGPAMGRSGLVPCRCQPKSTLKSENPEERQVCSETLLGISRVLGRISTLAPGVLLGEYPVGAPDSGSSSMLESPVEKKAPIGTRCKKGTRWHPL